MSEQLGKQLAQEASRRQLRRARNQLAARQHRVSGGILRRFPRRLQWMLPIVEQHLAAQLSQVQALKSKLIAKFKKPELPPDSPPETTSDPESRAMSPDVPSGSPRYHHYPCVHGHPLHCPVAQDTIADNPKAQHCHHCGFPTPLAPETIIQGDRDRYQIQQQLPARGMGRLYKAIQLSDRQPVILKDYPLPERYFSPKDIQQRKERFRLLANIHRADRRIQDTRVILPKEAIAPPQDPRYYLITPGEIDASPTLKTYQQTNGPLPQHHVQAILNQVLQSLEFLHEQKFQLQSGTFKQGIYHRNLSLTSLLITLHPQGFFIHLCDLGLWEHLSQAKPPDLSGACPQTDLNALGTLALSLLSPQAPQAQDTPWPPDIDPFLKEFILKLMQSGTASFKSAQEARQALLSRPQPPRTIPQPPLNNPPATQLRDRSPKSPISWKTLLGISLIAAGLVILALIIRWLLLKPQASAIIQDPVCCIDDVGELPPGHFTYSSPAQGTWSYILETPNLIAPRTTLQHQLQPDRQGDPDDEPPPTTFRHESAPSAADAIGQVLSRERDFAIMPLTNAQQSHGESLHRQLGYQNVAYDGIVVFVAFSYSRRHNSLPQQLNGQLTLEQLRQLYRGDIDNWQDLGGPNLPVQLYVPERADLRQYFEQQILQTPQAIADFRDLQTPQSVPNSLVERPPVIQAHSTFEMLRTIIRDFEQQNLGSIGFAPLSQVFGQCSVYPLALSDNHQDPISPLIQHRDGEPISPDTDLCNSKGSYGPNITAFTQSHYPLAYPLAVIYPRDNRLPPAGQSFAEILTTLEVQQMLHRSGLIPLHRDP